MRRSFQMSRSRRLKGLRGKDRKPMWCNEHMDFCWLYDDGSKACWWECVVESNSDDCQLVPISVTASMKPSVPTNETDS